MSVRFSAAALVPVLLLAAARAVAAPAALAVPATDHLVFDDGDHVHGTLAGFDAAGLRWQLRGTAAPAVLGADRLDELVFAAPQAAAVTKDMWEIRLVGGDRLRGKLLECGPEKTVLEAVGLGRVECPTRAIVALAPVGEILWEGPGQAKDWRVYEGDAKTFKVENGALVFEGDDGRAGASAGLPLPFPERFRLDVRIEPANGLAFNPTSEFQIHLMADGFRSENPGGYGIAVAAGGGGVSWGIEQQTRGLFVPPAGRAYTLAVLVDAGTGAVAVMCGGETLWAGKAAAPLPKGKLLLFPVAHMITENWKVSKLRLSAWNGLEAVLDEKPEQDLLRLQNGDRLRGELLGVADGRLRFRSALGEVAVPVARLQSLVLSAKRAPAAKAPGAGAVRVDFGGGDRLVLEVGSLAGGVLSGRHGALGACAVPQAGLERMVFNLGAPFRVKAAEVRKAQLEALEELSGMAHQGGGCEGGGPDPDSVEGGGAGVPEAEPAAE